MATSNYDSRQTASVLVAGFSFLVLSAYLLLWRHSNQDIRITIASAVLFFLSVVLAPRKDVTICAAFLFAGLRWAVAAIITFEARAIIGALLFLSVPALLLFLEARRQRPVL